MITYHISYYFLTTSGETGFGNCQAKLKAPPRAADMRYIEETARDDATFAKLADVKIINIFRLADDD
jgi:hypothetical protein